MKNFLKQLLASFGHFMIAFTLVMYPYPQTNIASANEPSYENSNVLGMSETTNAAGEDDCVEDPSNQQGTPGVYKPGCDLNNLLTQDDFDESIAKGDSYRTGFAGYVEQFVGALFAMIGILLIPIPFIRAVRACPQHMGPKATFPLITAGSLSYLIGEAHANKTFKEASKMAVDKAKLVTAQKQDTSKEVDKEVRKENEKANQEQYNAFLTLIEVYQKHIEGLNKKITGAGIAEAAYIAAEVVEITDMLANAKVGEATSLTVETQELTGLASAASGVLPASTACPQLVTAVETYVAGVKASDVERMAKALERAAKRSASKIIDAAEIAIALGGVGLVIPPPKAATEAAEEKADAAAGAAIEAQIKALRATNNTAITTAAGTCPASISAFCSATVVPAAVAACIVAQTGLVTSAITATTTAVTTVETAKNTPVLCMGTNTEGNNDGDTIWAVNYSVLPSALDQNESATAYALDTILNKDKLYYVKSIISNFFHRMAYLEVEKIQISDPVKKVKLLAKMTTQAEHMTKLAMEKINKFDFEKKLQQIENEFKVKKENLALNFPEILNKLKEQMIATAHAGEPNAWKEALNIGIKAVGLYLLLGKYVKNYALPKPTNRALLWAGMAAVNAAVIIFDNKRVNEINERISMISKEAQRFADSAAVKTEVESGTEETPGPGDGKNANPDPYTGGSENLVCASTNTNGNIVPADCPATLPKKKITVPRSPTVTGAKGGLTDLALDLVSDTAHATATGGINGSDKNLTGNLRKLENLKDKLIGRRGELRKEFDDREKRLADFLNKKTGKKIKPLSIAALSKKINNQLGQPMPADLIGPSGTIVSAKEDSQKSFKETAPNPTAAMPSFQIPNNKGNDFDFDLGEDGGTATASGEDENPKAEEDLAEFQLNENDIIDNPDASIFKVISNRYLRSYPVLLEEKEQKQ